LKYEPDGGPGVASILNLLKGSEWEGKSLEEIGATWQLDRSFEPRLDRARAQERRARWHQAVERARGWAIA
jgi:glycerol kinase